MKQHLLLLAMIVLVILVPVPVKASSAEQDSASDQSDDNNALDDSEVRKSEDGLWLYYIIDGDAVLVGYKSDETVSDLVIPDTIDDHTVIQLEYHSLYDFYSDNTITIPRTVERIERNPFRECENLKNIIIEKGNKHVRFDGVSLYCDDVLVSHTDFTAGSYNIPDGITSIGNGAFAGHNALKEVFLPESITHIGEDAFIDCASLSTVNIPAGVNQIEEGAFIGCSSLHEFGLSEDNNYYYIDNRALICRATESLIYYLPAGGENTYAGSYTYTIPEQVKEIGDYAFYHCQDISEIVAAEALETIGDCSFTGSSVNTFYMPDSVVAIGVSAFSGSALERLSLSANLTSISDYAFSHTNLETVSIPEGVEYIGCYAFAFAKLNTVELPDTLVEIDMCGFDGNPLTCIELPASMQVIGSRAFYRCGLESVTISGKPSLEEGAFQSCYSLTSVSFEDGVQSIGDVAFLGCSSLNNVSLPSSVTRIGNMAFQDCSALSNIQLEEGLEFIGLQAFSGCAFYEIHIPDSVKEIGDLAFNDCKNLETINMPMSIETLGDGIFGRCKALKEINVSPKNNGCALIDSALYSKKDKRLVCLPAQSEVQDFIIPDGIKILGTYAALSCENLKHVEIPDSVTEIRMNAFVGCTNIESVKMSKNLKLLGTSAFGRNYQLSSISLPSSLTQIDDNPFSYCYRIANIDYSPQTPEYAIDGNFFIRTSEKEAFMYPEGITDPVVTVPDGVEKIGSHLFCWSKNISTVILPDSVKSIGDYAFQDCKRLDTIELPQGLEYIGDSAFRYCEYLETLRIPESVIEIGYYAFSDCPNLKLIVQRDSFAADYCEREGLNYEFYDSMDWLKD